MNNKEWFRGARGKRPNRGCIWNETYGQCCVILWPCSTEQLIQEFSRHFPEYKIDKEDIVMFEMTAAKFVYYKHLNFMAFKGQPKIDTIVHECTHLMSRVLDKTCLIPWEKDPNEEAHAYFIGWAAERIWTMVRKHK